MKNFDSFSMILEDKKILFLKIVKASWLTTSSFWPLILGVASRDEEAEGDTEPFLCALILWKIINIWKINFQTYFYYLYTLITAHPKSFYKA